MSNSAYEDESKNELILANSFTADKTKIYYCKTWTCNAHLKLKSKDGEKIHFFQHYPNIRMLLIALNHLFQIKIQNYILI